MLPLPGGPAPQPPALPKGLPESPPLWPHGGRAALFPSTVPTTRVRVPQPSHILAATACSSLGPGQGLAHWGKPSIPIPGDPLSPLTTAHHGRYRTPICRRPPSTRPPTWSAGLHLAPPARQRCWLSSPSLSRWSPSLDTAVRLHVLKSLAAQPTTPSCAAPHFSHPTPTNMERKWL